MAVKYSKQRDFGAKGRKTKKLGNKMFKLVSTTSSKLLAKGKARLVRSRGKLARVVKMTKMGKVVYGVYSHSRQGRKRK
tara:strand:- start:280 stop:516 length:237 start_codon:yes stop_codon:yes gene_type:complete